MKNNIKNYTEERCREILKKVGVEEGQIVLDFGCGGGNYTIPAAKIIGNAGKIYAVDEDEYKLKDLLFLMWSYFMTYSGISHCKVLNYRNY